MPRGRRGIEIAEYVLIKCYGNLSAMAIPLVESSVVEQGIIDKK